MDFNVLLFSGNLTADPIARGGGTVAAMSVASNRNYQQNGEWVKETTYLDCTAFGHNATRCIEKLLKGDPVTIQGRLELHMYENGDGEKRRQIRCIINSIDSPVFTTKLRRAYRAIQAETGEDMPVGADVPQDEEQESQLVAANGQVVADDDIPF